MPFGPAGVFFPWRLYFPRWEYVDEQDALGHLAEISPHLAALPFDSFIEGNDIVFEYAPRNLFFRIYGGTIPGTLIRSYYGRFRR